MIRVLVPLWNRILVALAQPYDYSKQLMGICLFLSIEYSRSQPYITTVLKNKVIIIRDINQPIFTSLWQDKFCAGTTSKFSVRSKLKRDFKMSRIAFKCVKSYSTLNWICCICVVAFLTKIFLKREQKCVEAIVWSSCTG